MIELQPIHSVFIAVILGLAVVISVWRAVVSARTPQGAVAWVVFLLAAPWFAVPAYVIFGHHKLRGYQAGRRASRAVMRRVAEFSREHRPEEGERADWLIFERLAGMRVVGGNKVHLLVDGPETFGAIHAAIESAEHYLCVQYYTIEEDETGDDLATWLIAAAKRGVEVRVIYDGVGSYGLSAGFRSRLEEAGIRILDPRKVRGPTSRLQINFRNHRKTVIVDGKAGFTGGLNVGNEYSGRGGKFDGWRDTHLRLEGPAVAQLQLAFAEDWHWATGEELGASLDWTPEPQEGGVPALVVPMGPVDDLDTGALYYFNAIAEARERIWIASPYFVPDVDILTALKAAALRGCDVRLILPEVADHWLTWLAAYAYFDEVRAAGVQVWRYQPGFMHQKVVLVDNRMAGVGTANLDNRSFRLNFETMAMVFDSGFAGEVEAMLSQDLLECERLDKPMAKQRWLVRLGAPMARLLAPVL